MVSKNKQINKQDEAHAGAAGDVDVDRAGRASALIGLEARQETDQDDHSDRNGDDGFEDGRRRKLL